MSVDTSTWKATASPTRMADALLRAQGGGNFALRMPAAGDASDAAQVGLGQGRFEDLPLTPAVFRKARVAMSDGEAADYELLLSATAVEQAVGTLQLPSADALFAQALAALVGEQMFTVTSVTTSTANGEPYLYRLLLRALRPQAQ